MDIKDLEIGDIIISRNGQTIELHIIDLSDDFMIQNEVNCLINNNGCHVYRLME